MSEDRKGMEWWDKFCALPTFSFWRGPDDEPCRVVKVPDKAGNWVELHPMMQVADASQKEINRLNSEREALRSQLQNCVNLLHGLKRHGTACDALAADLAIGAANRALYETRCR